MIGREFRRNEIVSDEEGRIGTITDVVVGVFKDGTVYSRIDVEFEDYRTGDTINRVYSPEEAVGKLLTI